MLFFPKASHVLGMNARQQLYVNQNPKKAKKYGFSKLRAKEFLAKQSIGVPQLFAHIGSFEELKAFDWSTITDPFAMKPANGSAGKGILVFSHKDRVTKNWVSVENREYSISDLELHASNILEGQYSTWGASPRVIIEERVPIHPDFESFTEVGTPDVRIILYHKIPVMAMIRIPTKKSGGRANLDLGALGLGIDMGTGKTTYGLSGKKTPIRTCFDTDISVTGIQIPFWTSILKTSVRVCNATGYKFMGVDIFLHPEKGPMVAELNGFPGLSIQLANRAGLRQRLERLEGIDARNVSHAVKIGQSLFAESYPTPEFGDDALILSPKEEIAIFGDFNRKKEAHALINTGRLWSAIAYDVAQELGLSEPDDQLWEQIEDVASGHSAPVVQVKFRIKDRVITTAMVVSKRLSSKSMAMHIGRRDLKEFVIHVGK